MSEDKVPQSNSEGLSGKNLLEFEREISGHAEREVSRVGMYYKLAAGCITLMVVVIGILTFKDAADFRKNTREDIKEQKELIKTDMERQEKQMQDRQQALFSEMQSHLSQQVGVLNQEVERKVGVLGQKVEKKIDEQFKTEKISKLVTEKATERIDTIAIPIINDIMTNQIQPKIDEANKNIQTVKGEIAAARDTLQNMQNTATFLAVVTAAKNDDRDAFEQLWTWSNDKSYPLRAKAEQAVRAIISEERTDAIVASYPYPFKTGVDPSRLSLPE